MFDLAKIGAWLADKAIIIGAVVAIFGAYTTFVYVKATNRERAKWEEKVRIAKKAANDQDAAAEQRGRKQAQVTIDYLKQQKAIDDAAIEQLKADLKKPVSKGGKGAKSCIVDKFDAYQLRN